MFLSYVILLFLRIITLSTSYIISPKVNKYRSKGLIRRNRNPDYTLASVNPLNSNLIDASVDDPTFSGNNVDMLATLNQETTKNNDNEDVEGSVHNEYVEGSVPPGWGEMQDWLMSDLASYCIPTPSCTYLLASKLISQVEVTGFPTEQIISIATSRLPSPETVKILPTLTSWSLTPSGGVSGVVRGVVGIKDGSVIETEEIVGWEEVSGR